MPSIESTAVPRAALRVSEACSALAIPTVLPAF